MVLVDTERIPDNYVHFYQKYASEVSDRPGGCEQLTPPSFVCADKMSNNNTVDCGKFSVTSQDHRQNVQNARKFELMIMWFCCEYVNQDTRDCFHWKKKTQQQRTLHALAFKIHNYQLSTPSREFIRIFCSEISNASKLSPLVVKPQR